jgi:cephalosporin-C deacetylase-like acetyl esterase
MGGMTLPTLRTGLAAALLTTALYGHAGTGTDPATLFDYDRSASLEVREIGTEKRDTAVVHDLTFVGVKQPVKAYLVTPADDAGPFAGILYVHWLGDPATTNRTEFLGEAVALAGSGIVSLLVDTMWARPKWYDDRIPEEDFAHSVRQVIELRRAMDVLLSQPNVDPKRIALVGHDYGAMHGIVMGAADRRAKTYVLMAGTPHFIDWALYSRQPKDVETLRRQLAPIDPVSHVAKLAPATVFFQFADTDEYVPATAGAAFYAAATTPKHMATYKAGHDLHTPEVAADRIAWLLRALAPAP